MAKSRNIIESVKNHENEIRRLWLQKGQFNLWGTGMDFYAIRPGATHAWAEPSHSDPSTHYWPIGYDTETFPAPQGLIDAGNSNNDLWDFDIADIDPGNPEYNGSKNILVPGVPGSYIAGFTSSAFHPVMADGSTVPDGQWLIEAGIMVWGRTDDRSDLWNGYYYERAAINTIYVPNTNTFRFSYSTAPVCMAPTVGWQRGDNGNYDEYGFGGFLHLLDWPDSIDIYADHNPLRFHITYGWKGASVWASWQGPLDPRTSES